MTKTVQNLFFTEDKETGEINYDQPDLEKCRLEVRKVVMSVLHRYNPNHWMPKEDIAWDCFTTLYQRNFFRFDPERPRQAAYLQTGVRNYLIDLEKREKSRISAMSADNELKDDMTLYNLVDDRVSDRMVRMHRVSEALDVLRRRVDKRLSYSCDCKKTEVPEIGYVRFDEHTVACLYLFGYSLVDIGRFFCVPANTVGVMYSKAVEELHAVMESNRDIDSSDVDVVQARVTSFDQMIVKRKAGDDWSGTPVGRVDKNFRLKFIEYCRFIYLQGGVPHQAIQMLGLKNGCVYRWKEKAQAYFAGWSQGDVEKELDNWEGLLSE